MTIYQFSAKELIALLREYGVTQQEIARQTGLNISTVNRASTGEQKPREASVDKLIELAKHKSSKMSALRDDLIAMIDGWGVA
nr:MAG TPA: regulatory protein/DNA complex-sensing repressor [Caudoviricetes sp.]